MKSIKNCVFSQLIMLALLLCAFGNNAYANEYIVTYNCGDAYGIPWTTEITAGADFKPHDADGKCYKAGYILDYWSVSESGDKLYANSTVQWNYTTEKTLTAQYLPAEYTITYDANVPDSAVTDVIGKKQTSHHVYDTEQNLNANQYKLTGWVFTGWNTSADGKGNSYGDAQSVLNLTTENNVIIPLYAQWERGVKTCVAGKYLNGSTEDCELCELGMVCPGIESVETGYGENIGLYECPENSTAEGYGNSSCTCTDSLSVEYGTAYVDQEIVQWNGQCTYSFGVSVTGNPCKIENNICVETSCKSEYEMLSGRCHACDRENALTYHETGNCLVKTCAYGYHPYMKNCYENIKTCMLPNATYAIQTWNDSNMAFGPCVATECEYGYHIENDKCQQDIQPCTVKNGIGEMVWDEFNQRWGDCIVTRCTPGYTSDKTQTSEYWEQCGRCNNKYGINGEIVVSSYLEECEIGACLYQGEKYILENNECRLICTNKSDNTGIQYWDKNHCVQKCNPGYTQW